MYNMDDNTRISAKQQVILLLEDAYKFRSEAGLQRVVSGWPEEWNRDNIAASEQDRIDVLYWMIREAEIKPNHVTISHRSREHAMSTSPSSHSDSTG